MGNSPSLHPDLKCWWQCGISQKGSTSAQPHSSVTNGAMTQGWIETSFPTALHSCSPPQHGSQSLWSPSQEWELPALG